MDNTISVIVPVFNEKKTLQEVIQRIYAADFGTWNKEIIVVDDGSTDGTADIVRGLPESVIKIILPVNSGKGSAVKAGLVKANGSYCVIQDADLEYHPDDIQNLLKKIKNKDTDVIYGSRNIASGTRHGSLIPRIGVFFITKLTNALFQLTLTDIWTCYKLFPKRAARFFTSGRFESEIAFTIALANNGFLFSETAITYTPRDKQQGKKIKYRDGILAIFVVLKTYLLTRGRILRYIMAGCTGITINIGIYTLLLTFGFWYVTAATIAFSIATIVSFLLQKYWTFGNRQHGKKVTIQFGLHVTVVVFNIIANSFFVFVFVDTLAVNKILSEALSSFIIAIWSYFAYKFIFHHLKIKGEIVEKNG